jgi:hypothetical protein
LNIMEFGVRGMLALAPMGVVPGVTANVMLAHPGPVPQSVVAAHAVYVGGLVAVMVAEITP